MAFDGGIIHKLTVELNEAEQSHIEKIYQPSHDELVFLLRKKGFSKKLLISARPGAARIYFTEEKYENPEKPPMFCMLARKHFSSARFLGAYQRGLERVIELRFEASNELGDRVKPKIVCELIGNQSNIVMVGDDGRIIDAVRRSDIETAKRMILPGAIYEYPLSQGKIDLVSEDEAAALERVLSFSELPLSKAFLSSIDGLSPLICREMAFKINPEDKAVCEIGATASLKKQISFIKEEIESGGKPIILYDENGIPMDFSYTDISQYGELYSKKYFNSYSELLEAFYAERELKARISRAASDVIRLLGNLISRANKRLAARKEELRKCADRETLRIYGELIKANLHIIRAGASSARVNNFYDENLAEMDVPLNPALSPSANAAHYFKEYKKSYTAEQTLTELTRCDEEELLYLESVLESITRCRSMADIAEIREELRAGGYIRASFAASKKKKAVSAIKEYTSIEGYKILVGRNNLQNDRITTYIASKNDLWFHVKGMPGSHVVVLCDGAAVGDETLVFAAKLAAANSKAAQASNVPVDYTSLKYVKKPNGAKPGMVVYTTNKTLFVTPDKESMAEAMV